MRRIEYEHYSPLHTTIKAQPIESVLGDIANRFEVLDVAFLNDFVGPCHPNFYLGIAKACGRPGFIADIKKLYGINATKQ